MNKESDKASDPCSKCDWRHMPHAPESHCYMFYEAPKKIPCAQFILSWIEYEHTN